MRTVSFREGNITNIHFWSFLGELAKIPMNHRGTQQDIYIMWPSHPPCGEGNCEGVVDKAPLGMVLVTPGKSWDFNFQPQLTGEVSDHRISES